MWLFTFVVFESLSLALTFSNFTYKYLDVCILEFIFSRNFGLTESDYHFSQLEKVLSYYLKEYFSFFLYSPSRTL